MKRSSNVHLSLRKTEYMKILEGNVKKCYQRKCLELRYMFGFGLGKRRSHNTKFRDGLVSRTTPQSNQKRDHCVSAFGRHSLLTTLLRFVYDTSYHDTALKITDPLQGH